MGKLFLNILLLVFSFITDSNSKYWCGYRERWGVTGDHPENNAVITYEESSPAAELTDDEYGLNVTSGIFKAPRDRNYVVTFAAALETLDEFSWSDYAEVFMLCYYNLPSCPD